MELLSSLVTVEVAALAAAVVAVTFFVGQVPVDAEKRRLRDLPIWKRLLPLVPLALGVAGAFVPGIVEGPETGVDPSIGERVLVGLWAAFVAAHARKAIKRGLLGRFVGGKQDDGDKDGGTNG